MTLPHRTSPHRTSPPLATPPPLAPDAAPVTLRVIGLPGAFAAWGIAWVCQILEHAGHVPRVVPLADAGPGWQVGFGHVPVPAPAGGRGIVFLDTLAAVVGGLLMHRTEPVEVVRDLAATLAPLASVLREPGVLLVRREPSMDVAATRRAIARHLLPAVPPPETAMPCEAAFDPALPEPQLSGQALALTRQVLAPMLAFAIGEAGEPIVLPLSCFYSGDHPGEQASPIVDTVGPARILYYGPYFHLPPGRWRVDIQLFFPNDVPDSLLAAEALGRTRLARIEFRPTYGGLFQASMNLAIDRTEERIEFRVWLLGGTISGQLGLRQILLVPLADR